MDYKAFVVNNIQFMNELSNRLIITPTEQVLKECTAAIIIRVLETFPVMDFDTAAEHSWKIVEDYLLPMTQNKQQELLKMIGSSQGITNTNTNTTNDFSITTGKALGLGVLLIIFCFILGGMESVSDGTVAMIGMIGIIILLLIPKKD